MVAVDYLSTIRIEDSRIIPLGGDNSLAMILPSGDIIQMKTHERHKTVIPPHALGRERNLIRRIQHNRYCGFHEGYSSTYYTSCYIYKYENDTFYVYDYRINWSGETVLHHTTNVEIEPNTQFDDVFADNCIEFHYQVSKDLDAVSRRNYIITDNVIHYVRPFGKTVFIKSCAPRVLMKVYRACLLPSTHQYVQLLLTDTGIAVYGINDNVIVTEIDIPEEFRTISGPMGELHLRPQINRGFSVKLYERYLIVSYHRRELARMVEFQSIVYTITRGTYD